jgi:hypothetical protein
MPSLNGAPSITSASWFDPSSFRHLRLAHKMSLKAMATAVFGLRQTFGLHGSNLVAVECSADIDVLEVKLRH